MTPSGDRPAEAVRQLPAAYALALRMRDAGAPDAAIADLLGIEEVALGPLLLVAEAKLEAILHRATPK